MKNLISILCMGLSMLSMGLYGKNKVSGDLRWVGTRPPTDCPVSLGIPFLKGELEADGRVVLNDRDGADIPSDCWPLAYWPDGSVKWLGVAAVVPGEVEGIRFETAGKKHKAENRSGAKVRVDEAGSFFRVSTGKVEAYVPKRGSCLLDSLRCEGRTVGGQAALLCSTQDHPSAEGEAVLHFTDYRGQVERVTVERAGDIRALVRIEGRYANDAMGRKWLPFTVRFYFYAGSEQIKMVHSFVFDGDMDRDFIRSLGIRFEVPMREEVYNRHVAFATADGGVWAEPVQPLNGRRILTLDGDKGWQGRQMRGERIPAYEKFDAKNRHLLDHWAVWNGFRLSQTTADAFSIRKRTHADRPWIGTFSGTRAPGYVFAGDVSGGLGVALKDFWQSYTTGRAGRDEHALRCGAYSHVDSRSVCGLWGKGDGSPDGGHVSRRCPLVVHTGIPPCQACLRGVEPARPEQPEAGTGGGPSERLFGLLREGCRSTSLVRFLELR